jgi:streptogramin lyase
VVTRESGAAAAARLIRRASLVSVLALVACAGAPATSVPLADRQIAVLQLDSGPDWLTTGFDSIWVKRDYGDVLRIDPVSHEILATIRTDTPPFGLCQGIGADARSIWSCSESESDIVRIDPTTNATDVVVRARKIEPQGRLVAAAGKVWILSGENGEQLVGVDSDSFEVGPPIDIGAACSDLAAGGGAVWAVCSRENLVLRIDPAAGSVTDRIAVTTPTQISVGADAVWVGSADGIVRIDLEDRSTRVAVKDLVPGDLGSVWASPAGVWVRAAKPFLTRIDPATSRVVETITASEYGAGDVVGFGDDLWASDSEANVVVHLRAAGT